MTPLPDHLKAKVPIVPPPELAHYLAQQIEAFIWRGRKRPAGSRASLASASQSPASCQAERSLRMRENPVTYTLTGHPLRRVDRAPGRGEYRLHAEEGRVEISAEDAGAELTIRTPTQ